MKKFENRGFLLVETLVVATFCITVLVMLFLQFKTLIVNYNDSYKYNTVEGIYKLKAIKKYLQQNGNADSLSNSNYILITNNNNTCSNLTSYTNTTFCNGLVSNGDIKTLLFSKNDTNFLNVNNINGYSGLSIEMKKFLKRLNVQNGKNRLVAEFKDGTFASITYSDIVLPMLRSWTSSASTDFHKSTYRSNITSVDFVGNTNVPGTAVESWDVSYKQGSRSVMAWVINDPNNSGKYKLYIGGDGKVYANPDSSNLFYYFNSLTNINNISLFDTSKTTNMSQMFYFCRVLTGLDVSHFDTSNVTNMYYMFNRCDKVTSLNLSNFNTSNVTDMSMMFAYCSSLTTLNLSSFKTSNVTAMGDMFLYCSNLASITLNTTNFDTSNVINMGGMFSNCNNLTSVDVSKFKTSNVISMADMFNNCNKLTVINVSGWNTSNVTSMRHLFWGCKAVSTLNVSGFNTAKVTDMCGMFRDCIKVTSLSLTNFNTAKVTDMSMMFSGCSGLTTLNLRSFNTAKVTTMLAMFGGCSNLTTIYASNNFVTTSIASNFWVFDNQKLVGGNGTKFSTDHMDHEYARIDRAGSPGYFTS